MLESNRGTTVCGADDESRVLSLCVGLAEMAQGPPSVPTRVTGGEDG